MSGGQDQAGGTVVKWSAKNPLIVMLIALGTIMVLFMIFLRAGIVPTLAALMDREPP